MKKSTAAFRAELPTAILSLSRSRRTLNNSKFAQMLRNPRELVVRGAAELPNLWNTRTATRTALTPLGGSCHWGCGGIFLFDFLLSVPGNLELRCRTSRPPGRRIKEIAVQSAPKNV